MSLYLLWLIKTELFCYIITGALSLNFSTQLSLIAKFTHTLPFASSLQKEGVNLPDNKIIKKSYYWILDVVNIIDIKDFSLTKL